MIRRTVVRVVSALLLLLSVAVGQRFASAQEVGAPPRWKIGTVPIFCAGIGGVGGAARSAIGGMAAAGGDEGSAINVAPPGFIALFNGRDLSGWKGLVANPPARRAMSRTELSEAQKQADALMRAHWRIEDGALVFDGHGSHLVTARDYGDFELLVDWKIEPGGDSGIYLRGSPQVQIWDNPIGSGGLYNNQKNPSRPMVFADRPPGQWNTFRIIMIGENISVWLNDICVVEDVPLENYWERDRPIYERGAIELQSHGSRLCFRNIYLREITEGAAERDLLRETRMDWWREARFGMFIHWGLYAIPAGEWKSRPVRGIGEWIMHYAQIPPAEYEPLVGQFNPVKFDAEAWVKLAKGAGMKYIVITSKHHDGFCLFDSAYTDYDVMSTPFGRDILRELADACRRHGLRMCWYHSIMDWHHDDYLPRRPWDPRPPEGADFDRYVGHLKNQLTELVTNYGPIGVLWFDGEWESTWDRQRGWDLYGFVRRLQPEIIINNRVGKGRQGMAGLTRDETYAGDFGTPEQEIPGTGLPGVDWETCMTMNDTWGYKKSDRNWKSTEDLIRKLVDIASKGGNFLLNVGPTAMGEIPDPSIERLEAVGAWMEVNGQSVYGTSASPFRRLPWGRCTQKALPGVGTLLYLHVFRWPSDGELHVPGLKNEALNAYLLADPDRKPLKTINKDDGVLITVPARAPDPVDSVIALVISGPPDVERYVIGESDAGVVMLSAADAEVHGSTARYESGAGKDNIGYWSEVGDWVSWSFRIARPGRFRVMLEYACASENGGTFRLAVDGGEVQAQIKPTGSWTAFATLDLGEVEIGEPGRCALAVKPIEISSGALMNLKCVRLERIEIDD